MSYLKSILIAVAIVAGVTSCKTPKDITYFQGQENGQTVDVVAPNYITAQPDDRLTIVVHSRDAQLSEMFNLTSCITIKNNRLCCYFQCVVQIVKTCRQIDSFDIWLTLRS